MITVYDTPERQTVADVKGSPATVLAASSNQLTPAGVSLMTSGDRQRLTGDRLATAGEVARQLGINQDAHGRPSSACSLAPIPIVHTAKLARRRMGRLGPSRPQPLAEGRL